MHDVLIIGAGPAGIAAALWCDELGLDTLVLEQASEIGGQLLSIYGPINNYPGLRALHGREFLATFSQSAAEADFDLWTGVEIATVDLQAKRLTLRSGEQLQAIALVIATGVRRKQLGIPGEQEFAGRGLMASVRRDRDAFAGRDVCVIGGGDAAAENALLLAEVCPTVTLVHRGRSLRARPAFAQQLHTHHCITVFPESNVTRILGSERVEAVEIFRKQALQPFQMAVQGIVVRIGVTPNTELFGEQLARDDRGYAVVSSQYETNVTNVFAIGDISAPLAPTIAGASGAGASVAKVIAARLLRQS